MILLEFFGMPAVGKTTTVKLLLRHGDKGVRKLESIHGKSNILIQFWRLAIGIWLLRKNILKFVHVFSTVSGRSRTKLLNIILKIGLVHSLSNKMSQEIVACEQLILQDIWSIIVFEEKVNFNDIFWFLSVYSAMIIEYNIKIIILDVHLDVIEKRYLSRKDSKDIFSDTPKETLKEKMIEAHQVITRIIAEVPKQQVIHITEYQQLVEYLNENQM